MGNYRQHLGFAGFLGGIYAWGASALAGLHWLYGSVAALLVTISGLLPDLDHPVGVELKGLTGVLGVLTALALWQGLTVNEPDLAFELHLWAVILAYFFVRFGLRQVLGRLMVHRGISHSIPTCGVWGVATYLYYPSHNHLLRLTMATAVVVGFLSHLLLDECFSVDITGRRLNRAFGTAMKFWAPSGLSTLAMYGLLSYLLWRALQVWPDVPLSRTLSEIPEAPRIPWPPPRSLDPRNGS